jgi:hypothetical protein
MNQLKPGQTYEISDAYIGQYQKLPARVIIHRLTDEQTRKRWKNQALKEKKKGIVMKERSKRLSAMNVYITNALPEDVQKRNTFTIFTNYDGKSNYFLKHGNPSLKSIIVKRLKKND